MTGKGVYLIGDPVEKLGTRKLPTVLKVLQLFFFKHLNSNLTIRQCFNEVVDDVVEAWKPTGIPVCQPYNAVTRIMKIYREWELLKKNKKTKSLEQKIKRHTFLTRVKNLFDISSRHPKHNLTEAQSKFLDHERKMSNRHSIFLSSVKSEDVSKVTVKADDNVQGPSQSLRHSSSSDLVLSSNSVTSSPIERTHSNFSDELKTDCQSEKMDVVTPGLVAALDRTKTSDRSATFILAAAADSFGVKLDNSVLSHSTIRRKRMKMREDFALKLKETLKVADNIIVHWDGKLLPEYTGIRTVDRLPIVVTGLNTEHLLGVPQIDKGTGVNQATAVVEALRDWNLEDRVRGMCFDTASVNTGKKNGSCAGLEGFLERRLLHFACRHRVFEIILRNVFEVSWPVTRGPEVAIFKRFQKKWSEIDQANYKIGLQDNVVVEILNEKIEGLKHYISNQLQVFHPRDDNRELLELGYIFLGGTPPNGITFKLPGAMHHARWLSKAIYCLKIFMFQNQFSLSHKDIESIRDISIFVVNFHIKSWFESSSAINAPLNDLSLMKSLIEYRNVRIAVANAALDELKLHLWYLSEDLVSLSFFDVRISVETRLKMVNAIKQRKSIEKNKIRFELGVNDLNTMVEKDLSDFISVESLFIFEQFGLSYDFLDLHPDAWEDNVNFIECKKIFNSLKVVNDVAERGVALITNYNRYLTRNEEQKQYLLQLVQHHRQQFPNCIKTALNDSK